MSTSLNSYPVSDGIGPPELLHKFKELLGFSDDGMGRGRTMELKFGGALTVICGALLIGTAGGQGEISIKFSIHLICGTPLSSIVELKKAYEKKLQANSCLSGCPKPNPDESIAAFEKPLALFRIGGNCRRK